MSQRDLSGHLARWSLQLQSFSFEIRLRKGSQNVVPGTLSRYAMDEIEFDSPILIDLTSPAFQSEDYCKLLKVLENEENRLPDIKIVDKFVYKRTVPYNGDAVQEDHAWKLWVPAELTVKQITDAHEPPKASQNYPPSARIFLLATHECADT